MTYYTLSPYVHFIEDYLTPENIKYGLFHRLTGDAFEVPNSLYSFLLQLKKNTLEITREQMRSLPTKVCQTVNKLIQKHFFILENNEDPLTPFKNYYVVRPMQNTALTYMVKNGNTILVRTSGSIGVFSVKEFPPIIEENMSAITAQIFLLASGEKTLLQIFKFLGSKKKSETLQDSACRTALEFLTDPERQMIKLAAQCDELDNPNLPFNIVHRTLYHNHKMGVKRNDHLGSLGGFHHSGIEDAAKQFDWMEPTICYSFRFPQESLGGLDYGSRFYLSTLKLNMISLHRSSNRLQLLEVGSGTGHFASSFIKQAAKTPFLGGTMINYHIFDLSPTLIDYQKRHLSRINPPVTFFQGNAELLDLQGKMFDLIIVNEVIADFHTVSFKKARKREPKKEVKRVVNMNEGYWENEAAHFVKKYNLPIQDVPETIFLNIGVFQFIERAWQHLSPGGIIVIVEYGSETKFPVPSNHLNHEEYSIHFGHVIKCATKIGFHCVLKDLKEFLEVNDEVIMLNGHQEHILCLNYVLNKYGMTLPYAAISKKEFEKKFFELINKIKLTGISFAPLSKGFHFGPDFKDFKVLILKKPN